MAVPNVLSALALTEDGANAIKDANPFPALLRLFYHPKYAMPNRHRGWVSEQTLGHGGEPIAEVLSLHGGHCSEGWY